MSSPSPSPHRPRSPADPDSEPLHSPRRSFSQPQFPAVSYPRFSLAGTDAFSPLCASARTSYTRVDAPTSPGTPLPEPEPVPYVPALVASADPDDEDDDDGPAAHTDEDPEKANHDDDDDHHVPVLPQVFLTFLLVSGRRRTMAFDPEMSIARVKELAWDAWPSDWQDERPPAPSYLRILYLGKILQDDDTLAKWSFPVTQPPSAAAPATQGTIVHLSVRSHPPPAEDAPKKKRRRGAASPPDGPAEEEAGCCSCIIC